MPRVADHIAVITKIADERYHVLLRDRYREIDEEVEVAQLMAVLDGKTLVNRRGEIVRAEDILLRLNAIETGFEMVLQIVGDRSLRTKVAGA